MSRKLYFPFVLLFCLFSFSQEISGTYCSESKNQKKIWTITQYCFTFNENGSFTEEIKLDVGLSLTGKYTFSNNEITLIYDDEKFEKSILKIIEISDEKIIYKEISPNKSRKKKIINKNN